MTGYFRSLVHALGSAKVGHTPLGTSAEVTTVEKTLNWNAVNVFRFMTAAQIADVQAKTALIDVSLPFAVATSCLVAMGGGDLIAPRGTYLLNGIAGADTYKNGILLPDTNGDFATRKGIKIIGEGVETVFKAGSANMVIIRSSRLYSGGDSFRIDGAGLANVIGLGLIPESLTQTTELVSQSFGTYRNVHIENCTEGTLIQPGPTVTGSDSGCFYFRFYDCSWNLNTRHLWLKKDVTGMGNRTTRTAFYSPVFMRGNTGVQIDGGTEIDFYSPEFELINTGVLPSATPTAFNYNDNNPANIRIFGGYAEACTKPLVSISPQHVQLFGFKHSVAKDASEYSMGKHDAGVLVISKIGTAEARASFGAAGFVDLIADPDQDGSKTLALQLNGMNKMRWNAVGSQVFYGSQGNITKDALGRALDFSYNGSNFISALGAGASLYLKCNYHGWQTAEGVDIASMSASEFIPRVDNATSFGLNGYRWKENHSTSYRPGTGAAIWTSGAGTPEGVLVASVGSLFTRTDGGAGTTLYVKQSGVGNTGWIGK